MALRRGLWKSNIVCSIRTKRALYVWKWAWKIRFPPSLEWAVVVGTTGLRLRVIVWIFLIMNTVPLWTSTADVTVLACDIFLHEFAPRLSASTRLSLYWTNIKKFVTFKTSRMLTVIERIFVPNINQFLKYFKECIHSDTF